MTRAIPEWIAKHDDEAIPPRVKVRLFDAAGGQCQECGRMLRGADRPEYDHVVALINGGEHRESNLRVLCLWCHKGKTRADVAEKSRVYRKRKSNVVRKPRSITGWRRFDGSIVTVCRER